MKPENTKDNLPESRKNYSPPQIHHLGSIKELTKGQGGSSYDASDLSPKQKT